MVRQSLKKYLSNRLAQISFDSLYQPVEISGKDINMGGDPEKDLVLKRNSGDDDIPVKIQPVIQKP